MARTHCKTLPEHDAPPYRVSIFDLFSNHDTGNELKAMSNRLDQHREILDWVALDLHLKDVYNTGRQGLPAESILRCALLKQYRQLSYQELAFHLSDSASFQAFARLPGHLFPKKSVLQNTISRIQPGTWEGINHCLLVEAKHESTYQTRSLSMATLKKEPPFLIVSKHQGVQ